MAEQELISIEVVYALPQQQKLLEVRVPAGAKAREIVLASGLDEHFPQLDLRHAPIGVFGSIVRDDYPVRPGDRIEIYRPLVNEPRAARRAAAARGDVMGTKPAAD